MDSKSEEENIIYSKYPDVELPSPSITVTEMLWSRIENWLDATAFVCGITGESYTYRKTKEMSCNFAGSLLKSGVVPGELVGLVSTPCPTAVIAVLGIWQAGCIYAPLNPLSTQDELVRDIQKLGLKYMVTKAIIYSTIKLVPSLEKIILLDYVKQKCTAKNKIWIFEDMVAISHEFDIFYKNKSNVNKAIAIMSSSSGSTGLPKTVILTHYSLCCASR